MPSLRTKALFHFDSDFSDAMGGSWTVHSAGGYPIIQSSGGKYNGYYQAQVSTQGNGNYLEYAGSDSFFDLTEGDFTIDCWIKSIVSTIYLYNTGSVLFRVTDSKLSCFINDSSNEISSDIDTTNWTHVALVHKATSYYLFINGIKAAEKVMPMPNDATKHGLCWCHSQNWEMRKLSADEFRIVEGAAWTSDFVPSNSPYSGDQ
jgi:hypothetical protein